MSDHICEDNLSLILRLLPVKPLLRFRCVSKRWKELIDSPLFVQEHLSFQNPSFILTDEASPNCLVVDPHATPSIETLDSPIPHQTLEILGTHNGVVSIYYHNGDLMLWNPSIRKSSTVPLRDYWEPGWEYTDLTRGCCGFWIDPLSKEFKFIILNSRTDVEGEPMGVSGVLYSSIQQDWRVIPLGEVGNWMPESFQSRIPVMVQGVAHWRGHKYKDNAGVALPWYPSYENRAAGVVLSFDFARERFDYIEMLDLDYPVMCHWKGALALVAMDERLFHRYDVHLWQDGLWVNMFGFYLVPRLPDIIFWVLGDKEKVRALATHNRDLVLYDSRDGLVPLLDEFSDAYVSAEAYVAYDFVESLLFPPVTIPDEYCDESSDDYSTESSSN